MQIVPNWCEKCEFDERDGGDEPCVICTVCGDNKPTQFKPKKPPSNADRIRAMTDEELAVLLAHETYRMAKPVFDVCGYGITEEFIFAQRLEWLQRPAKGE